MSLFPVVHTRMLGTYLSSHQFAWVLFVGLIGLLLTETSMAITLSNSQSARATFVYSDVDTTAQLMGRVLNEDGIAVVGANIRLNDYVGTYTDSSGLYIIKGIESGEYKLQISHIGYVEYQRTLEFIPKDKVFIEVRLESKPYENGTIVVTASRTQEALSQVSVPMIVVPKREIQQSGNLRLSDVLSEQLGLYLVENHGTGLQMQGFDPEYTLILIDNQPVIGRTAGTLNLSRLGILNR
jgi:outer membrane receptor for ferrienterochelin and colicins